MGLHGGEEREGEGGMRGRIEEHEPER